MRLPDALKEPRNRVIAIYIAATLVLTCIPFILSALGMQGRNENLVKYVYLEPNINGRDLIVDARFRNWHQLGAHVFHNPGTMEIFNFLPLAFFVILFFLSVPHPVYTILLLTASAALIFAVLLGRVVAHSRIALGAILAALCTSYPFAFLLARANIEGIVWIPSVIGVYLFSRKKYLAASISFAVATSLKPFPAMFFLLLLFRHRYREVLVGAVTVAVISLASWSIIGPTLVEAMSENVKGFQLVTDVYAKHYHDFETPHDHSLLAFSKQAIRALKRWPPQEALSGALERFYPYYAILSGFIFVASVLRLRKLPALNQILGVSILMILLSPVNNDYTLIGIYIPWAILLIALSRSGCSIGYRPACLLMILFAVLFTPQGYLLFGGSAAFGAQVKTLALCAILLISVIYPLPMAEIDEREPAFVR